MNQRAYQPRARVYTLVLIVAFLVISTVVATRYFYTKGNNEPLPIILISIDTLRADHLGCYGYERNVSPIIDAFCKDSVRFAQVIAQAPSTAPSHASMFTSLVPSRHGTSMAANVALHENFVTMTEILQHNGFATASFNGGGQLAPEIGISQGFDVYNSSHKHDFQQIVDRALPWMRRHSRFFLFLHTYEVHLPYQPKPKILEKFETSYTGPLPRVISNELIISINKNEITLTEEDKQHIINCYDSQIRSVDFAFGELIKALKQQDLYDNAFIIFTSDHGEELGEHGKMAWHSHTLYDELIKVPLIIKFPDSRYAGRVVDSQIRSIDIMPTVLDYLHIPCDISIQGVSLLPYIQGQKKTDLVAISELVRKQQPYPIVARTSRWKLTNSTLIDLQNDPAELGEAINDSVSRQLRKEQEKAVGSGPDKGVPMELSETTEKELRALGYIN